MVNRNTSIIKNSINASTTNKIIRHKTTPISLDHIYKDIPTSTIKKKKINDNDFKVLLFNEHNNLVNYNYTVPQLREIASYYKLKKTGNKPQLLKLLYNFLFLSSKVIKIQSLQRKLFIKKFIKYKGPAFNNTKKCVNETDCYSLENLSNIDINQFFSFIDTDGKIYGFDICSLYEILKQDNPLNPYNRNKLDKKKLLHNIKKYVRISKILGNMINITIEKDIISPQKTLELRIHKIFQTMDELGNYTSVEWFTNLNANGLVKFIRELCDIWMYRLNLSNNTKRNICPFGDPFRNMNTMLAPSLNLDLLKKQIITVMENMIYSSNNNEYKSLGCIYVLTALTLVRHNAATTMPWLYQSVAPEFNPENIFQ